MTIFPRPDAWFAAAAMSAAAARHARATATSLVFGAAPSLAPTRPGERESLAVPRISATFARDCTDFVPGP
jgi:hypothetical protein